MTTQVKFEITLSDATVQSITYDISDAYFIQIMGAYTSISGQIIDETTQLYRYRNPTEVLRYLTDGIMAGIRDVTLSYEKQLAAQTASDAVIPGEFTITQVMV
jgi:uncharacterized membrane protein